ncbi:hypothetical protein AYJ05_05130 [Corynebacterium stationis]|uniref:Uncharacterized protein n=1 Tax=Corynebacterium stationis TaxID=1705 RepID=A0A177IEL6_9CORY|nr:hypothetical protein [Corynebacterium stationis]OAH27252.1 hypothetical protein AYJ05_05130 [Corynebacterium stationis]
MDMREQVWSPLQNTAVWMGAWLYGHEPADDVLAALNELGGAQRLVSSPDDLAKARPFIDALSLIREATSTVNTADGPSLRLVLAGPGDPPALPAGSPATIAATNNGSGALVVRTHADNPADEHHLVLVPEKTARGTDWTIFKETAPLPSPAWLSPGDADALLSQATEESAALIEAMGYKTDKVPNPRLTVGTLADFYDTPGLPSSTPARSAKLFARADRVAAIIETVTDRVGDHSLDPQLFRLWRHVRAARVAGVDYALMDFARGA